jgi:hypothetical protein
MSFSHHFLTLLTGSRTQRYQKFMCIYFNPSAYSRMCGTMHSTPETFTWASYILSFSKVSKNLIDTRWEVKYWILKIIKLSHFLRQWTTCILIRDWKHGDVCYVLGKQMSQMSPGITHNTNEMPTKPLTFRGDWKTLLNMFVVIRCFWRGTRKTKFQVIIASFASRKYREWRKCKYLRPQKVSFQNPNNTNKIFKYFEDKNHFWTPFSNKNQTKANSLKETFIKTE